MTRLALVVALLVAACRAAKPEASALVVSVDRFHRAGNEERPARADGVAALACTDREVCEAREACVRATAATAGALRAKDAAEAILAEVRAGARPPDDPAVRALPEKLDQATHLLEEGRAAMPGCDHRILVLRERYGL